MNSVIPDLWPAIDEPTLPPPVAILRQQGIALGQRTANLVYGEVKTISYPEQGAFTHVLWVVAPFLGFRTPILVASHKLDLYPVEVGSWRLPAPEGQAYYTADNPTKTTTEEEFKEAIKSILGLPANVKLLRALISQSEKPAG